MKIYTKTGDKGETSLFGRGRVPKDDMRIQCVGMLDELNAHLGWVNNLSHGLEIDLNYQRMQCELFELGARVAAVDKAKLNSKWDIARSVQRLENEIDSMQEQLPALTQFILPGGHAIACALHIARTKCRDAERTIVAVARIHDLAEEMVYLNRLSDWLFVAGRFMNQYFEISEPTWTPQC